MPAQTTIAPGYRWRLGLIALVCLGFGALCLKDGFVTYPEQRVMFQKFEEMKKDGKEADWPAYATAQGWPETAPKERYDYDIMVQFIMAGVTLPFGLLFGWNFLKSSGRWIASDEEGLSTSWGARCAWSDIVTLNKDRWRSKGIAVVTYNSPAGEKRIVLDDWKFDRVTTTQIEKDVEDHLRPDQIIGDDAPPADPTAPKTDAPV